MKNGSKATPIYEYVPLSEYLESEHKNIYYPSAKLVYDALANNTFNADTKYY